MINRLIGWCGQPDQEARPSHAYMPARLTVAGYKLAGRGRSLRISRRLPHLSQDNWMCHPVYLRSIQEYISLNEAILMPRYVNIQAQAQAHVRGSY